MVKIGEKADTDQKTFTTSELAFCTVIPVTPNLDKEPKEPDSRAEFARINKKLDSNFVSKLESRDVE